MSVLLGSSLHRIRRAASLAGAFTFLALGATSALAAGTSATGTNPASSALGPVSTNAAKGTGGAAGTSALGSSTRSGGAAAGSTPATGPSGTGAGGTPAGAAPTTSVPTTTYAPPATGRLGGASPEIQRAGTPAATTKRAPGKTSSSISAAAIALAALAALLALAAAAWAIARWQAYEPHWTVSLRHAMAEAGFRASATWAEFTDWVRLGR
ncbi:MAG: hypothetical protein E6G62_05745 [Actinobacteria bacterium]|nr:MAG: hypothetical protein E6G62_05745 [Actinomycetota bacterium]